MINELIIFEYFTSQEKLNREHKEIFCEAVSLVNYIARIFDRHSGFKKIYVLRNSKLDILEGKKINFCLIDKNNSLENYMKCFKPLTKMILLAPETNKIYLTLAKEMRKKFMLLNPNNETLAKITSKVKTVDFLIKNKVPCVPFLKNQNKNSQIISKPDFGAGSDNINFVNDIVKRKGFFYQKFFSQEKGSLSMLCKDGKSILLSCNKQIVRKTKKSIRQIGVIVGGAEEYRCELDILSKLISDILPGLNGFVGVDIIKLGGKWNVLEINGRFTSSLLGIEIAYGEKMIEIITNYYVNRILCKKTPKLLKTKTIYFDELAN